MDENEISNHSNISNKFKVKLVNIISFFVYNLKKKMMKTMNR